MRIPRWLTAALLAGVLVDGHAQVIEDVTTLTQEGDAIARISFAGNVRLIQQSPIAASTLYQIRLDFAGTEDSRLAQNVDENRRQEAAGGVPGFSLLIKAAPRQKLRQMVLQLTSSTLVRVQPGPNKRSLDIVFRGLAPVVDVPAPVAAPDLAASGVTDKAATAAEATPAVLTEIDVQGNGLLGDAKDALTAKQNDRAIEILNRLLRLPPNTASREAQELVGLAWERAGDARRARAEYELYLRLFPAGEGADRVAQRLAALNPDSKAPTQAGGGESATPAPAPAPKKNPFTFAGNLGQYYFGGKARSQSLVNLPSGIDQSTLTKTTESALVTSLDISGRYQGDDSDIRMSVRGTGATNLAKSSHNASNLSASYIDYRQPSTGMTVRLGRQSPVNGGLLGVFDGVAVAYPFQDKGLRVEAMGGVPANTLVKASSQRMAGAVLEADNITEHWGGSVYYMGQTTDGFLDRSGLGSEIRYSDDIGSGYALIDYDTKFKVLNVVSVQASVQGAGQTSYTALVDVRRAPTLELNNALISAELAPGDPVSIKTLLQSLTMDDIVARARNTSAIARQAMLSASRPLSQQWQITGDLRYSAVGALPPVGNFEATLATGAQYGASLQLTGSNLYSKRDINNFNVSWLSAPTFKGVQAAYNNLTSFMSDQLTVEPSIRFYSQRDSKDGSLTRVSPGLRLSYRVSKKTSVMGEGLVEHSQSKTGTNHDTINSVFFYLGYRYDLF
jgi:hypothetical protein